MKPSTFICYAIAFATIGRAIASTPVALASFPTPGDGAGCACVDGASAQIVDASTGKPVLVATFANGVWPAIKWDAASGTAWDWSKTATLVLDIQNPSDTAVTLNVRVDDDAPIWSPRPIHVHTGTATIAPHSKGTYFVDLANANDFVDRGMKCMPAAASRPGMTELAGTGAVDPSHVIAYQLFVEKPASPVTVDVSNIRLLPSVGSSGRFDGILDQFGQYSKADWSGKVHDASEMIDSWTKEREVMQLDPTLPNRDVYGGWINAPKAVATGHFSVLNRDRRWWFVDPLGSLFYGLGVNGPLLANPTTITGREAMFASLPPDGDPLAVHYAALTNIFSGPVKSGKSFDFQTANLQRKFGVSYADSWRTETVARLKYWGINSMSGWNIDLQDTGAIPFMKNSGIPNYHAKIPAGGWGPMDDPWDPAFASDARERFTSQIGPLANNPMCIGVMVGNEMSWGRGQQGSSPTDHYHLAFSTLALTGDSPAKQYFVAQLRTKYVDITSFNTAWGASASSWDALLTAPFAAPKTVSASESADMSAFLTAHAERWFMVVRDELKAVAPNTLFLGCRFAEFTPEAVAAAAKYSDVVSFNIYHVEKLDPAHWGFLKTLGKPVMVSEWHFGARDRGMFGGGLGPVANQAERAAAYRSFTEDLLDNPAVVGEQWFQYSDQPLTGRTFDGENYNIGFVAITDQPYPQLTAAVRSVGEEAYQRRLSSPPLETSNMKASQ